VTVAQIAQYASLAGFTGADLLTAVAIALAESSGDPKAYNGEAAKGTAPGRGSYGLWQIYLTAHPEYSPAQLLDPQQNALAAYALFRKAGGFTDWATYNTGIYRAYLATAGTSVQASVAPAPRAAYTAGGIQIPLDISGSSSGLSPAVIALGIAGGLGLLIWATS